MADMATLEDDAKLQQVKRLVAAHFALRARRNNKRKRLDVLIDAQSRQSDEIEQRIQANSFTVAAVMASCSIVHRERWTFQRNERWFEDTLPNLGENHFKQAFRVSPPTFRYLVESCRSVLERQTTRLRKPISVEKRVAVGLYRLCSSAEDRTIAHLFGIGRSTVNVLCREFCKAVIDQLEGEWLHMIRRQELKQHIREFFALSGFPQGIGALDGCHFCVSPPKENAVDYHNYKGWYSIILLAMVDHMYRFRYINIGAPGRCHDANVYARSRLSTLVEGAYFSLPVALIEDVEVKPIILCDQAFPLTTNLLKPFSNALPDTHEAAFNYNLSRTRRIVENAFGRLKARFRFIMKRMECTLPNAKHAIRASCILHNICEGLRDTVEQQWENEATAFDALYEQPSHTTTASTATGHEVRAALAQYFWKRAQQNTMN
ncbi:uncharacterized protein LOC142590668 [Dermacentor variabilis]|uniref:uncharacterized protein LOC142590668 n=1 Tax=Dermacentor variabilis TaxID=34621 RepID=UPI003F5BDF9B